MNKWYASSNSGLPSAKSLCSASSRKRSCIIYFFDIWKVMEWIRICQFYWEFWANLELRIMKKIFLTFSLSICPSAENSCNQDISRMVLATDLKFGMWIALGSTKHTKFSVEISRSVRLDARSSVNRRGTISS